MIMKSTLRIFIYVLGISAVFAFITYCTSAGPRLSDGLDYPERVYFNTEHNGKKVDLYTLQNKDGLRIDITNYGGRIVSLFTPDKNGVFDDIVTGYHSLEEYLNSNEVYFGALIGRYGNRIANGRFSLDGIDYSLATNNGTNHLHGGPSGFHNVVWDAEQVNDHILKLTYLSAHMEEGYPGNLSVVVFYSLTNENELVTEYEATTDKPTVINLTNHAFFNLAGEGQKTINNHLLKINADFYTPVFENLIPTGHIEPVADTPFDFRDFTPIGERLQSDHPQLQYGLGYDHNYMLRDTMKGREIIYAASVYEPISGRMMDVYTTEPGLQFYGGNFLNGSDTGKRGEPYLHRSSFCLETQHFPDSPNQPQFPSTVLRPGEVFRSKTIYRFSVAKQLPM
jgi:aldose 1-epimerase